MSGNQSNRMSGNDPFFGQWRLEMSFRIVSIPGEVDSTKNTIDLLHCFAPEPLSVAAVTGGNIGREDSLLAAGGQTIDPILGGTST